MIALVAKAVGHPADLIYSPMHPADVPATWANVQKAEQLLGWSPEVSLEEGVARMVAWYRENRAWAAEVATD